ncbi:hypothetical protein [Bradyrhizobium glycinis]|uniref:hypothetical protein n=1 Tax=Bradyrhizobium glycinis TaxID=2751812 RepID=UPI0018DA318C|nr:hypothetical protein [Bradyrhizobium glycinis]MBH5371434.1 hypothetical protein [Bradyrhizobium glycinis]
MQQSELTRMAIASAVAIVAISYLAVDAGLVNTNVITRSLTVAQASTVGAATGQRPPAFTVQDRTRRGHAKPQLEYCLAVD